MQAADSLTAELERSREDLLELAARVRRLITKRSERQIMLQRLRRSAALPGGTILPVLKAHNLCSGCATDYANLAIQNVRGATAGATCDQCGQPAIVWIQLKPESEPHTDAASVTRA